MTKSIAINYEGKLYNWDGQTWYRADDYLIPSTGIIQILNKLRLEHHGPFYPQSEKKISTIVIDKNEINGDTLTDYCVLS